MVESARSKLKTLKIVLWCILGAILLFIFIVVGTLLVDKYIKKSPVPMFAGCGSMIVVTGSMSGTIERGDLIIVKRASEYTIQKDIVTFVQSNGEVVTHRLVNYIPEEDKYVTKGDFNTDTDIEHISVDQIAGKVVLTIPKVGLFFEWVLHDFGIIYIIALLAVIVAGVYFLNLLKREPEAKADAPADTAEDTTAQHNEEQSQD